MGPTLGLDQWLVQILTAISGVTDSNCSSLVLMSISHSSSLIPAPLMQKWFFFFNAIATTSLTATTHKFNFCDGSDLVFESIHEAVWICFSIHCVMKLVSFLGFVQQGWRWARWGSALMTNRPYSSSTALKILNTCARKENTILSTMWSLHNPQYMWKKRKNCSTHIVVTS